MDIKFYLILIFTIIFTNSLSAQTYFELKDGQAFFADIKSMNNDNYVCEKEDRIIQIPKSEIKLIETEEDGVRIFLNDLVKEIKPENSGEILYRRGNNVYVPYSSTRIIIRSGSKKFRELLMTDGFWNIVGTREEAHCIFQYYIDYSGRDKAYFKIIDKQGKELWKSSKVSARDLIPHHAGEESAERLYKSDIRKLKNELKDK